MARGDTYIGAGGGGEGGGGGGRRGGKPHPRGTRGAAGGGGEGGGVWSALDPGSGPARRGGSRPGRRAREEPAAPGPAGGSGAGRAAMRSAAPQSEGPRRAAPAPARGPAPASAPAPAPVPAPAPAVAGRGSPATRAGCAADARREARGHGAPPAPGPRFGRTLGRNWLKVFGDGVRRDGREDGERGGFRGPRGGVLGTGSQSQGKRLSEGLFKVPERPRTSLERSRNSPGLLELQRPPSLIIFFPAERIREPKAFEHLP